jgi:hypothetical protein
MGAIETTATTKKVKIGFVDYFLSGDTLKRIFYLESEKLLSIFPREFPHEHLSGKFSTGKVVCLPPQRFSVYILWHYANLKAIIQL